jgi:hypothetical protein
MSDLIRPKEQNIYSKSTSLYVGFIFTQVIFTRLPCYYT